MNSIYQGLSNENSIHTYTQCLYSHLHSTFIRDLNQTNTRTTIHTYTQYIAYKQYTCIHIITCTVHWSIKDLLRREFKHENISYIRTIPCQKWPLSRTFFRRNSNKNMSQDTCTVHSIVASTSQEDQNRHYSHTMYVLVQLFRSGLYQGLLTKELQNENNSHVIHTMHLHRIFKSGLYQGPS